LAYSFSEADYSKAVNIIDALPGKKAEIKTVYLNSGKPLRRWVAEEGIEQAMQWCAEGRDQNAWIDLEIVTDKVLTIEEQKRLRTLNPGIINIRPRLKTGAAEVISPQSREGRKIDELFKDYFKYRTGLEISRELMEAFIEILNDEAEEADDLIDGGAADETEVS
jgi:exonuclease SbcD